ncbi:MAG: flagellar hook-length control protein FliK [Fimbriimonadaceae bacterium]
MSFFSETDLVEAVHPAAPRPLGKGLAVPRALGEGPAADAVPSEPAPNPAWVLAASVPVPVPQFDPALLADLTPVRPIASETGSRPIPGVADEAPGAKPTPTPPPPAPADPFDRSSAAAVLSTGGVDPTLDRAGTAKVLATATLSRTAPQAPPPEHGQRTVPTLETANASPPQVDPTLDRAGAAAAAGTVARPFFGSRPASVSEDAPPAARGKVVSPTEVETRPASTGSDETAKAVVDGSRAMPAAPKADGPATFASRTVVESVPADGEKRVELGARPSAPVPSDPAKKLEADSAAVLQKPESKGNSVSTAPTAGAPTDSGADRRETSDEDAFAPVDRARPTGDTDRAEPFAARVVEAAARPVEGPNRPNPLSARLSMEVLVQIADRIEMLAAKSARREVVVHLEPEELGSVTMVVRRNGTNVEASVYASHEQVRAALDQNRAGLTQQLESRGLTLGGLTVGSQSAEARSNGDGAQPAFAQPAQARFGSDSTGASARPATIDQIRASIRKASGLDLWT